MMIDYYLLHTPEFDKKEFANDYAILGAQRNCKIIGIFTRLAIRDKKPYYLELIPHVWKYIEHDFQHTTLLPIKNWLDKYIPESVRDNITDITNG